MSQILVEREGELERLDRAIAAARAGDGQLVWIEGPAGIGKGRVLEAAWERAADAGMVVLTARANELERAFALGVVRQLFERRIVAASPDERRRLLAGPAAHAAPAVLSDVESPTLGVPGDGEFAVIHGLHWLALNIAAEGPLLLAVDDAHWADAASLRWLHYLATRLRGLGILVLVTTRPSEPGAEVELLAALERLATTRLRPSALSVAGCAAVVDDLLAGHPSDAFAAACRQATGGNPFLLHELVDACIAGSVGADDADAIARVGRLGPESVARSVRQRLAQMPAAATPLVQAVAILGDGASVRDVAALAGLDVEVAHGLADALAAAHVLAPHHPLGFAHPVVREAVSATIGPAERPRLHAAAAALLRAAGAESDRVALHLVATEAPAQPWAANVLVDAARAMLGRGAPGSAAAYLERALREPLDDEARARVLAQLGTAQWLDAQDPAVAAGHLRAAVALTQDPQLRATAAITLARAALTALQVVEAATELEATIEASAGQDADATLRMEAELGSMGVLNVTLMPSVPGRLRGFTGLEPTTPAALLQTCNLASLAWLEGGAAPTAALARDALRGGRLLAAESSDSIAYFQAAWALAQADGVDDARAACEAALIDARHRGSAFGFIAACTILGMVAWTAGDLGACEAHARAGIDMPVIRPFLRPALYTFLAYALIERGALDEAEQALEDGWIGPHLPELVHMNMGFHARALLRAAQGRDADALADFEEYRVRQEVHCGVGNGAVAWRVPAAQACLRLGRVDEARTLVAEADELAQRWGTATARAGALRGRALVERADAIDHLTAAVALLERSPARLERARAQMELGAALRRAGRRPEAQAQLEEAVGLAQACAATTLAGAANAELAAAGARPRRLQFSGASSLTASERRVSSMAAEGMSNQQIAQALYITPKTVENHLGRVYIKLGIRSRGELAGVLAA